MIVFHYSAVLAWGSLYPPDKKVENTWASHRFIRAICYVFERLLVVPLFQISIEPHQVQSIVILKADMQYIWIHFSSWEHSIINVWFKVQVVLGQLWTVLHTIWSQIIYSWEKINQNLKGLVYGVSSSIMWMSEPSRWMFCLYVWLNQPRLPVRLDWWAELYKCHWKLKTTYHFKNIDICVCFGIDHHWNFVWSE